MTHVNMTIPLCTDDGREFSEVSVIVEVSVTHKAVAQTWDSPAEGAEWEVGGVDLDLGKWLMTNITPRYMDDSVPLPHWLNDPVYAYIESTKGRDEIAVAIQEGHWEDL